MTVKEESCTPIEIVYWLDSCSVDAWEQADTRRNPSSCRTVGYVVYEDEYCISLASSLALHDGQGVDCCLTMTIPKVAITDRAVLQS